MNISEHNGKRILEITGKGNTAIVSTLTEINILLESIDKTSDIALGKIISSTKYVINKLNRLGIENDCIQTKNNGVKAITETRFFSSKETIKGYSARQEITILISAERKQLIEILEIISKTEYLKGIDINNTIKNPDDNYEALSKALQDAKNKSKIIAESLDLVLGKIIDIKYTSKNAKTVHSYHGKYSIRSMEEDMYLYMDDSNDGCDLNNDKISINDGITVCWEILDNAS